MKKLSKICGMIFLGGWMLFAFSSEGFSQQRKVHVVQKGETLFAISKRYNVSIAELKQWNNLSQNTLSIGQELVVVLAVETPHNLPEPEQELPKGESILSNSNPSENILYTVKSGDNLTVIARAHNMSVAELKSINGLESDALQVGQKLSVKAISVAPSVSEFSDESTPQGKFVQYTVQRGEAKADILERFAMNETELKMLNPEVNIDRLASGLKITVLLPPSRSFRNPYADNSSLELLGEMGISIYRNVEKGNTTANSELYNPEELTAAHTNIALGSILMIENPKNGKSVFVRINDRTTGESIKLSQKAATILELAANTSSQKVLVYSVN